MDSGDQNEDWISVQVSRRQAQLAVGVLLATVFGGVGYPILSSLAPVGYDRFTGEQGAALSKRIEDLERDVREHEREASEWKYRIVRLEEQAGIRK